MARALEGTWRALAAQTPHRPGRAGPELRTRNAAGPAARRPLSKPPDEHTLLLEA